MLAIELRIASSSNGICVANTMLIQPISECNRKQTKTPHDSISCGSGSCMKKLPTIWIAKQILHKINSDNFNVNMTALFSFILSHFEICKQISKTKTQQFKSNEYWDSFAKKKTVLFAAHSRVSINNKLCFFNLTHTKVWYTRPFVSVSTIIVSIAVSTTQFSSSSHLCL